jgi:hypothetical protein
LSPIEKSERQGKKEELLDSLEKNVEKQLNNELFSVQELVGKGVFST